MTIRQIPLERWQPVLDGLSRSCEGREVEIEVSGIDVGAQIQAGWTRLVGITYDSADDSLEVAVEGLVHVLRGPQAIAVDSDAGGSVRSLAATDPEGRTHRVRIRQPAGELRG